jgi:hypothetical protein
LVGLRRGEVISLRLSDYDATARKLTVTMAKGRKSRVVPLPANLCADIDAWLQVRPEADHDRLLTTRTGNPLSPTCLYRSFNKLVQSASLQECQITPHTLRHTAATLVLRNSGDLVATSRLLGHSSVAVTGDVYCHLTDEDVRRAVNYHPLAGDEPGTPPLGETHHDWPPVREGHRELVTECEEIVAAALAGYRKCLATNTQLADRWQRQSIVEAVCHYLRPKTVIPQEVVLAAGWENRVIEDYSLAEHQRIVALRKVLEKISDYWEADIPWSRLLTDISTQLTDSQSHPPGTWETARLDEIGRFVKSEQIGTLSLLARFSYVLAHVATTNVFGGDHLFLAQVAANIAISDLETPLTFFPNSALPLFRIAIEQASHGDASPLHAMLAARIADECAQITGIAQP